MNGDGMYHGRWKQRVELSHDVIQLFKYCHGTGRICNIANSLQSLSQINRFDLDDELIFLGIRASRGRRRVHTLTRRRNRPFDKNDGMCEKRANSHIHTYTRTYTHAYMHTCIHSNIHATKRNGTSPQTQRRTRPADKCK